ncbi:MAG: redoxin domain-containing protein [Chitinophagia bacterium]|jgi:thiol-disulfide isomerase/thioredoxin
MFKKLMPLLAVGLLVVSANAQNSNSKNISIKLTPLKNTTVYLGSYYGTQMALFDSAKLNNNSEGVFVSTTKLTGGIYFVVTNLAGYQIQFDLLIDDKQQFRIEADTSNSLKQKARVLGSEENKMYEEYKKFSADQEKLMQSLEKEFAEKKEKTKKDTADIREAYTKTTKRMDAYRDSIIDKYSGTLLAALFSCNKRPSVPEIPIVKGKPDSTYPYRFVKNHFWDDVDFSDDRLLHTPFFEPKLDEYFKNLISIEADSIIKEVNYILLSARPGKEIFPYLLNKFTKQYMNPQYMGQDKVFVFLFENFYAKGDSTLLDASNKKIVFERAYNLLANQIGLPAPPMDFPDSSGKITPLYNINAPFTVIAFWDPTCGHCKVEIPKLDSLYRAKWKALGVAIYAVNINEPEVAGWKRFVKENKLIGWFHTHESNEVRIKTEKAGQMNFRQAYDIYKTPTFYLLDKDKRIIGKQLSMEQFDEIIKIKLKENK